ncbi:cold-responsive protein kinase 1-like [Malania oleifera]|uniref:cold-responsive protein kinase 1-like n=1 Tax=Malania oleifera TaxID=397392 RepID=UPI0025AEAB75|nr:cold-responsive protein kinase 1-like [Malania oleifera]
MRPTAEFWFAAAVAAMAVLASSARSDPQANLLNAGCNQYNATNLPNFFANLNGTFSDLRSKLAADGGDRRLATAERWGNSDPVYAMVQCQKYLSAVDCLACFAAAEARIRNCSPANGARVICDGASSGTARWYESSSFYTLPGNEAICGNRTASQTSAFEVAVNALLMDLEVATPSISGFFAASKKRVVGDGGDAVAYGVAQCAETVSKSGCQDCLKVAYSNIQICPPNADGRAVDAGCFLRYSQTSFFVDNQTTNLTPFFGSGGSSKEKAIIGVVVGGVGLILIILTLFVWYRLSRKPKSAIKGDILGATELRGPVNYSYKDLKSATKNFSEENKLGEGGFGGVFKGILKNGKIVAVKKLTISQSSKTKADHEKEVKLISNVHHRKLIRLLGYCSKGPELLLVYEYMANSSLDKFLFGRSNGGLNWEQRFDIIVGMARGLAYLHEEFHVRIIHRDIKSRNILLDDDFQAKIADFGLARLMPEDQSHLSTKFAGTLGYTAPEYAIHGQLSEKVDTYGYGVVILETISGRKSNESKLDPESEYLLERAWKLYEKDMHIGLVDKSLDPNEYKAEDVKRVIEIALMCTQSSVALRPTMSEVVVLLLSKGSLGRTPQTRPIFVDSYQRIRGDTSTCTGSSSNATASFTQFSGR